MTLALMPLPLERIAGDITASIAAKLYYPALVVTLTVPDICVGLTLDRTQFVKQKHYVSFVDKYVKLDGLGLDGVACYQLRGGLVHRADLRGHAYFPSTHVIFTTPEANVLMHGFGMTIGQKSAMMFDLQVFCSEMIAGARLWSKANENEPQVKANLKTLIRPCPNGIPPFVSGFPVIASGE